MSLVNALRRAVMELDRGDLSDELHNHAERLKRIGECRPILLHRGSVQGRWRCAAHDDLTFWASSRLPDPELCPLGEVVAG